MEFENKIVLITGASGGIGRGLAAAFGEKEALVVVNYLKSRKEALDVVKRIKESGGQAIAIKADVSKRKDVEKMVEKVLNKFGRIDILINNAGAVFEPAGWQEVSEKSWGKTLAVNLGGVFNCIKEVAPVMLKQKHGKVINIASIAGFIGSSHAPAYSAAKAGVINLTQAFAKELAPHVNVNAVAPCWVANTDWHKDKGRGFFKMVKREVPMQRMAEIDDVVNAVLFLASEKASFITGQTLILDGGLSLK
jgi:3-oxoacyl-[acyl-carrier protein] reductase